jgi:hypothetical protein
MKLRATILCLLLSVQIAFAQRLFFATGIGTYEMGDLKATQDFVGASTPIPLTNISSFPAYWNYEGGIAFDLYDYLSGGVAIGYGSTGARSAYSDYSGSMRFDQLARYASIALLPSYGQYYLNDQVRINYELRFGMTFNRMAFSFEQTIAADSESESIDLRSNNTYLQPGISAGWRWKSFSLDAYFGYHIAVFQGKVHDKDDPDLVLVNPNTGKNAGVNWSGARAGFGVSFYMRGASEVL